MSNSYWIVGSYGYPNPFSSERKALQAWETFLSFFDFSSYTQLKDFWSGPSAPRSLNPHAVESWKATFEEFGFLYVISRSDEICITPAGQQFRNAAEGNRHREFGWIGLSLLLRYPLRGPRRPRGQSNLLLYWFLYAAMRELQNYFWWSELERVLCRVFQVGEAKQAVNDILKLRTNPASIDSFSLPVEQTRGGFYNSLNQVVVHASMNHFLWGKSNNDTLYAEDRRRHWILNEWIPMVDLALGGSAMILDCENQSQFIARMPHAPDFGRDEHAYFEYMGASVPPMPLPSAEPAIRYTTIGERTVPILQADVSYKLLNEDEIVGNISVLCRLAKEQRVILSHDLNYSYIVETKTRTGPNEIVIKVRRGRPITNPQMILLLLEDLYG